jgi:UDP-glucose 4-epimerase
MRLLITGGAGCLGSNLIEHYFLRDNEICIIDNFATSKREFLPKEPGLMLVNGSIADLKTVKKAFYDFQPTHVIHSAASYKDPNDWIEDTRTNVLGLINVAKTALEVQVKRFINFQTALCYGRPITIPISESHPLAPFTSYGISKTAGELYLMQSELPFISLRLANICGPRLAIGPIPSFYKRLKAGLDCFCSDTERDFLDMSDFLTLMDLVLLDDAPKGVFNVSTGDGHSMHDVFCAVADFLGLGSLEVTILPPAKDDIPKIVLDPTFTEKTFGWKAKTSFNEIILNQLVWYEQNGIGDIFSHLTIPKLKN